jgi:hypothetical protein
MFFSFAAEDRRSRRKETYSLQQRLDSPEYRQLKATSLRSVKLDEGEQFQLLYQVSETMLLMVCLVGE